VPTCRFVNHTTNRCTGKQIKLLGNTARLGRKRNLDVGVRALRVPGKVCEVD